MDEWMFQRHIADCQSIVEETLYLEIYNYSDPSLNTCCEHPLPRDELLNFIHRRGVFARRTPNEGVSYLGGIRLILQKDAKHPKSFSPNTISLPPDSYEAMMRGMELPLQAVELLAAVGLRFWWRRTPDEEDPHLQIIFRQADVPVDDEPKGWELILSYSFQHNETTGFVKGTSPPSSSIAAAITILQACAPEAIHPLLLPNIVLTHLLSTNDSLHRNARHLLQKLERSVARVAQNLGQTDRDDGALGSLDEISVGLTELQTQLVHVQTKLVRSIITGITQAMEFYWAYLPPQMRTPQLEALHRSLQDRLNLHHANQDSIESYSSVTLERLNVQQTTIQFINAKIAQKNAKIAQNDARVNLEIARDQRRLAHASKRDSLAMRSLSLLGASFLPGTFLASIFSMTFFDFKPESSPVSPQLWVYIVLAAPLTAGVICWWLWWERKIERRLRLEEGINEIEKNSRALE